MYAIGLWTDRSLQRPFHLLWKERSRIFGLRSGQTWPSTFIRDPIPSRRVMSSRHPVQPSSHSWKSFSTSRLSFLDKVTLHVGNEAALGVARAKLDRELQSAQEMVHLIRARRNTLSAINCFPPEVLAIIFGFLAADEPLWPLRSLTRVQPSSPMNRRHHRCVEEMVSKGTKGTLACHELGWIKVTHVCHLWRTVALAHPSLWGIDICSLSSWTRERLRRSKSAPIDVIVRKVGQDVSRNMLFHLLGQLDRTRTLDLSAGAMVDCDIGRHESWRILTTSPFLETFSQQALPDSKSSGCGTSLCGGGCPLPSSITELSLCVDQSHTRPFLGYCRSGLLAILSRLPQLRLLELARTIPSSDSSATEPVDSVPLRNLGQLKIHTSDSDCAWFLQHVWFPASAQLFVSISDVSSLSHLKQIGRSLLGMVPTQSLLCCWSHNLSVEGWKAPEEPVPEGTQYEFSDKTTSWSLIFQKLGRFNPREAIVDGLFGSAEIPDIKALRLKGNLHSLQWPQLSASLCALEYVSLGKLGLTQFLRCLAAPQGQHPGPAFLPRLRRIHFIDVMFPAQARFHRCPEVKELMRALTERKLGSAPIQELTFRCHDNIPALISQIREVVPQVSFYEVKPLPGGSSAFWPRTIFDDSVSTNGDDRDGGAPGNIVAQQLVTAMETTPGVPDTATLQEILNSLNHSSPPGFHNIPNFPPVHDYPPPISKPAHKRKSADMASKPVDNPSPDAWKALYTSRLSSFDQTFLHVGNAAALATARAKFDKELENVLAVASLLRARRNTFVTINCLPPELIALIFGFLSVDEIPRPVRGERHFREPHSQYSRRARYSLGWIKVSHVCQLWRTIALAHPSLWGVDIDSLQGWTRERLRRSKGAPIDVVVRRMSKKGAEMDLIFRLLTQLHRTRKLDLGCYVNVKRSVGKHILPYLSAEAPILESLSCAFELDEITALPDDFVLPFNFLATNAPRLRSLRLRNISLRWNCQLPRGLMELCLSVDQPAPNQSQTLPSVGYCRPGLLNILSQLPQLQVLELTRTIPNPSSDSPVKESIHAISLPNFQRLTINATSSDCAWFLERVAIPTSARLFIKVSHVYSLSDVEQIGRSLLGVAPMLSVFFSTGNPLTIKGWRKPEETAPQGPQYDFADESMAFHLTLYKLGHATEEIVRGLFGHTEIPSIKALRVEGGFQPLDWTHLSASLCALEYISINDPPMLSFIRCLVGFERINGFQDERQLSLSLFPNLHTIHFIDVMWTTDQDESRAALLLHALNERKNRSMPIQELILRAHDNTSTLISHIRKAVPRLSFHDTNPSPAYIPIFALPSTFDEAVGLLDNLPGHFPPHFELFEPFAPPAPLQLDNFNFVPHFGPFE
ncbi:hypothetical protein EVG20_g1625 [Dentipellis fragilis]|uniref:Uncharacterized protein n=1 Tax=Dentipellis fragilis TaxID=205917 RepID=A0A4Y9ZD95_9AGAM|nr:hypothetical protein EVG20_g1625 [Dentipellis fragilis]